MNNITRYTLGLLAVVVLTLHTGCTSFPKADPRTEEQTIRELDTQFAAAAAKRDAEAAVVLYAPDATILAPDAAAATGTDAIRAKWTEFLKTPGLVVNIVPERIYIATSADLATDAGRFDLELNGSQGHLKLVYKYLEVWRKTNGQWKVMYDTWNADAPAAK